MSRRLVSGPRPCGTPRSYHHLPPHVRPSNQRQCRPGVSPLNRPTPTPRRKVTLNCQSPLPKKHRPKAVKKCPSVKKSAARPHPLDYSKPSFKCPQERGLRVWYDEDKDDKDSPRLHPSSRNSRPTEHQAEDSLVPEDDHSPHLPPPSRRSRHTKRKTDHRIENQLVPVFARMSLEEVSRSDAPASASASASAATATAVDVASENQEASSQKAQECSRKRKLGDLKQELSNKQRKVEESRQELQAIIDRKLKELRQEMVELKQEVKERERKERAAFQVTMDTQSGRRKVWRRKQGNSSAQKTSTQPRPLKRLPDNSHHSGSTEAASQ